MDFSIFNCLHPGDFIYLPSWFNYSRRVRFINVASVLYNKSFIEPFMRNVIKIIFLINANETKSALVKKARNVINFLLSTLAAGKKHTHARMLSLIKCFWVLLPFLFFQEIESKDHQRGRKMSEAALMTKRKILG